jgi:hypothetical protein
MHRAATVPRRHQQAMQVNRAIGVAEETFLAIVTPGDEVLWQAGKVDAQLAGHEPITQEWRIRVTWRPEMYSDPVIAEHVFACR